MTIALLKADGRYLMSDGEVGRAGGIGPGDGLEVAPVMEGGRESPVRLHVWLEDLAAFAGMPARPRGAA